MVETFVSKEYAQFIFELCTVEQQLAISKAGGREAKIKACPDKWTPETKTAVANYILGLELDALNERMFSVFNSAMKTEHLTDSDCTIDPETNCCSVCGVYHGEQCPECGGRGFHAPVCPEVLRTLEAGSDQVN